MNYKRFNISLTGGQIRTLIDTMERLDNELRRAYERYTDHMKEVKFLDN